MPRFKFCLPALLLCTCAPCLAMSEAPIRSVVLYAGTAVVQRELAVAPGTRRVELGGLPTDFTVESLRLEGSEGVRLGQLSLKDEAATAPTDVRQAELQDRIQALKDQEAQLDVDAQSATAVNDLLGRISLGGDGKSGGPVLSGAGLAGILDTVRKASSGSLGTIHEVDVRKRELDKRIAAAGRDLDQLRSGRRDARVLAFDVAADRAGQVRISYPQPGAGWRPVYRALLDSTTGKVTLQRQAVVHQRTGEDWSGVSLRLSTGRPLLQASAPDASPWLIRLMPQYRAAEMRKAVAYPAAAPMPTPPEMTMAADMVKSVAEPEEFQATFATEFAVPLPVSLPSDGSEATLTLGDKQLDASLRLRAVPRLQAAAYVEAEAQRPEGDWLPGQVQLVRDGDYVGQTFWQPQANDRLLLPFGRDDLVRVRYERKQDRSGEAGLLGHRNAREVTDVYTITSSHRIAMPLLLLEATPVSADDEVKVDKDFLPTPDALDWDSHPGVVAWKQTLQPNATVTVQAHYTVRYPGDRGVVGLP